MTETPAPRPSSLGDDVDLSSGIVDGLKSGSRDAAVKLIAWAGLLVPSSFVVKRSGEAVLDDPFVAISVFRGIAPLVCLVAALLVSRSPLRPMDLREALLAFYLAIAAASVAWSLAPRLTLLKAGHLAISYGLLVLLARHWRSRRQALNELAILAFAIVIVAAVTGAVAPDVAFQGSGRLFSIIPYLHPVTLGLIGVVALIALWGGLGPRSLDRRPFLRAVLQVVALAVIVQTRTLSALVLVVISMAVYLLLRRRWRLLCTSLSLLSIGIVLALAAPWRDSMWSYVARGRPWSLILGLNGRWEMWSDVIDVVQARPYIGLGYYSGRRLGPYVEAFRDRLGEQHDPLLDGTWAAGLLETGLIGVLAMGAFVLVSAMTIIRSGSFGNPVWAVHVTLLFALLVFSVFDSTLEQVSYPMVVFGAVLFAVPINKSL